MSTLLPDSISCLFLKSRKLKILRYRFVRPSKSFAFLISKVTTSSMSFPVSSDCFLTLIWLCIVFSTRADSYSNLIERITNLELDGL